MAQLMSDCHGRLVSRSPSLKGAAPEKDRLLLPEAVDGSSSPRLRWQEAGRRSKICKAALLVGALITAAAVGSALTVFFSEVMTVGSAMASLGSSCSGSQPAQFPVAMEAVRHATPEELATITAATFEAKDGKILHIKVAGFLKDENRVTLISPFGSKLVLTVYEALYTTEGEETVPLLMPGSDEAAKRTTPPVFDLVSNSDHWLADLEPKDAHHSERLLRATPRSLAATPRQLRATPRQLRATPRQLKATPRQLKASPRHLKTSPRQLRASPPPRHLRGSPRHLKATPRRLAATPRRHLLTPQLEDVEHGGLGAPEQANPAAACRPSCNRYLRCYGADGCGGTCEALPFWAIKDALPRQDYCQGCCQGGPEDCLKKCCDRHEGCTADTPVKKNVV